jgi:hypothetical protein
MVEQGVLEPVLEDTTRYIPDPESTNGEDYKKDVVKTQVMHYGPNGGELAKHAVKRYTVDEIKEYMLNRKKQFEDLVANIKKSQEEQQAKEQAAKSEIVANSGSAVT